MPNMPLFAYGTLRDPDVLARVLGHTIPVDRLRAGIALNHQVVFFPRRTYPALRQAPGTRAPGTLIDGLTNDDLTALDAFEGDEYQRGQIEVSSGGASETAAVYWPSTTIEAGTEWRFEDWLRQHKAVFLAAGTADNAAWRAQLTAMRET
jgi:gamma-glutamylcyclotransferase (GGCT)/AIG2-like uncharacterized protein YtfP